MFGLWHGCLRGDFVDVQNGKCIFDLLVALVYALLIEVVQSQRLRQCEYMLGLIIANQCAANGLPARLATNITHFGQQMRITLSTNDSSYYFHACGSSHVTYDMVQLQVHQGQCFLHILDMSGGEVKQPLPLPQVNPKCSYLSGRAKAGTQ